MATNTATESFPPGYLGEYSGGQLVAISATFIALNTIFVVIRFVARRVVRDTPYGLDDYLILPAYVFNIGICVLGLIFVNYAGTGYHLPAVAMKDPAQIETWAKLTWTLPFIYLPAVALPKLSIIFLYLRIFTTKSLRWTSYALIGIVIGTWVAYTFATIFECSPVAWAWLQTVPSLPWHGKCFDVEAYYKSSSVPNIVTDLVILVLPIPVIWKLQMASLKKLGFTFIMMTGSVGIFASCMRLAVFYRQDAFTDNTWASVVLVGWSIVEPGMYLIAACLPAFRPLFTAITPKWLKRMLTKTFSTSSRMCGTAGPHPNSTNVKLGNMSRSRNGFSELHDSHGKDSMSKPFANRSTAEGDDGEGGILTERSDDELNSVTVIRDVWVTKEEARPC